MALALATTPHPEEDTLPLARTDGPIGTDQWAMVKEQAAALEAAGKGTGILPKGITNRYQVSAILMAGAEIGLGPMTSLRQISLINGTPTIEGKALLGLVRKYFGASAVQILETDDTHCTIRFHREGLEDLTLEWNEARAKKAGLWGKGGPWTQFPAYMLRWRCIAEGVDLHFTEVKLGLMTKEEMVGTRLETPHLQITEGDVVDSDPASEPAQVVAQAVAEEHAPTVVPFTRADGTVVDLATGVVLEREAQGYTKEEWAAAVEVYVDRLHGGEADMASVYREIAQGAGVKLNSKSWKPGAEGEYRTMIDWIAEKIGYTNTPSLDDEGRDTVDAEIASDDTLGF